MPSPDWIGGDYDPTEAGDTRLEIVGRGRSSRATKTNIPDVEAATILGRIGSVPRDLADILRQLHAHHYQRTVTVTHPDGKVEVRTEPEVLSYAELRAKYDCIRMWEEGHQSQVDHLVSVKGFSVIRATGGDPTKATGETQGQSSAGADGAKARWR